MRLTEELRRSFCGDTTRAGEAQRKAHLLAFGPMAFEVSRLMVTRGVLGALEASEDGLTQEELSEVAGLSGYATQVLLEAALTIGLVYVDGERFRETRTGWFLQNDTMVGVNMAFNHDVNYQGMFHLEESLEKGRPEGLKVFGPWPTIYEGLSSLPPRVQSSWFGFDHYYSDVAFDEALSVVFSRPVRRLMDVGGNTGRFALRCVGRDADVEVGVVDLPQQIGLMREAVAGKAGSERIFGHGVNLLDEGADLPMGYDVIWMSQFLDCFSEGQVVSILRRAAKAMTRAARLFIMETFWDRQRYATAAADLALTSLYFTAMANGNSKMYHSDDMVRCIEAAGLTVEGMTDHLGTGHTLVCCRRKQ